MPKVGDVVRWFDIGPMREYTGTVERIVSDTIVMVRLPDAAHPTVVFVCDLEPAR